MNHERLHNLTDGIFAIVMTLMVLELRVPTINGSSNLALWTGVKQESAIFISYAISFALLFVYWRAHNFVVTVLARNINTTLLSMNGLFLFLVGLAPFTTQLLGAYPAIPLSHCIYALNVIFIGLTLLMMRAYIEKSSSIESLDRTREQRLAAFARTLTPIFFAAAAIPLSFINTNISFAILIAAVVYNFSPQAGNTTLSVLRFFRLIQ